VCVVKENAVCNINSVPSATRPVAFSIGPTLKREGNCFEIPSMALMPLGLFKGIEPMQLTMLRIGFGGDIPTIHPNNKRCAVGDRLVHQPAAVVPSERGLADLPRHTRSQTHFNPQSTFNVVRTSLLWDFVHALLCYKKPEICVCELNIHNGRCYR
jgi:hypothetical protein